MKTTKEIIEQCNVVIANLNSGCVECNEKAIDFYKSIIEYFEILDVLKNCTEASVEMKTARELFEELEFELVRHDHCYIRYSNKYTDVEFDLAKKEYDITLYYVGISMGLHKAIHKQLQELRWIR